MLNYIKKLFKGSHSEHKLKQFQKALPRINELTEQYKNLSEEECQRKTQDFKDRLKAGETLDSLLPEAFALVRHAAMCTLDQSHFDVQMLGGMALHEGSITEMKTGEGKTLTSTLPIYLNALEEKGVHLVTVNDYLAKRDSQWMGAVFNFLGLSVGLVQHGLDDEERRAAYNCDVTYGTNNEFGFDYLRDNMKYHLENCVQRGHHYAIVDEVDSVLIDEARTPLIISGPAEGGIEKYALINQHIFGLKRAQRVIDQPNKEVVAEFLNIELKDVDDILREKKDFEVVTPGDYSYDEKSRNIQLTEQGIEKMEQRITKLLSGNSLYDSENVEFLHHVNQALKAHYVFKKDIDYVVSDNQIKIVDEFTGRIMEGRRYSDGLHQAIEAKEGVKIEKENQTLASITYQNYFRRYKKLAGMTGTAATEENEFIKIYGLGVVVIPTHRNMIRIDQPDAIYGSAEEKNTAILDKVREINAKGQPILLGTDSIEQSEMLSSLLKKHQIKHSVLNAKFHEQEAEIITNAGQKNTVTISTNMAGRGTDIKLGEGVEEIGGLYVLGAIRHESRRIDNQLRGRSGRQGDRGESLFILSLDDHLLKAFGSERVKGVMKRMSFESGEAIVHPWISKAIENAQKKVEGQNFQIRKHLLEFDDVMNRQREIIYDQRREILGGKIEDYIFDIAHETVDNLLDVYCNDKDIDNWDFPSFLMEFQRIFNLPGFELDPQKSMNPDIIRDEVHAKISEQYQAKTENFGENSEYIEKQILLNITDNLWKEHLLLMDQLRDGIGLRSFAQKNPLDEYRREAFRMFEELMSRISERTCFIFFRAQIQESKAEEYYKRKLQTDQLKFQHGSETEAPSEKPKKKPYVSPQKIERNKPCPCGSGKKFKVCDCEWKKSLSQQKNQSSVPAD